MLEEFADGAAALTEILRRSSNRAECFAVGLTLAGREGPGQNSGVFPPTGSPKQGLDPPACAENGDPIDPLEWRHYTSLQAMLTGCDDCR